MSEEPDLTVYQPTRRPKTQFNRFVLLRVQKAMLFFENAPDAPENLANLEPGKIYKIKKR